jgi:hypothetical protein
MIIWFDFKIQKIQRVFKKKLIVKEVEVLKRYLKNNCKDNGKWFFNSKNKVSKKSQKT